MSTKFMVKVRPFDDLLNVLEVPNNTLARAVDSEHYLTHKKIRYLGSETPHTLEDFGSFSAVEIETGFEQIAGTTTVVYVDPKNEHLAKRRRTLWPGDTALFIHENRTKQ
jgi:hypothetical protein